MRFARACLLLGLLVISARVCPAETQRAIYFYETRAVSLCEWSAQLDELAALGYRRIFLNLEEGNVFLLDEASSRQKIAEMARLARARGLELDALTLQDTRWLEDWAEGLGRVARLKAFLGENPRAFRGVHIDVEPHTRQSWTRQTARERYELLQQFAFLLGRIRKQLKDSKPRVKLSAALPWWFAATKDEGVRKARPAIDRELDEVILMAYDEPGKKLFGDDLKTLEAALDLHRFLKRLPRGRTAWLALATYDFPSSELLARTVSGLESRFRPEKRFSGVAVFHRSSPYDTAMSRSLSGLVLDAGTGEPLAGATVEIVGENGQALSGRCGDFRLTTLDGEGRTLRITKEGYETATVAVPLLEPLRATVLPATRLRPLPKASTSTIP